MIFTSVRHNLANLFRLSGRDSRALFWPYAIAIFLLTMVADILLFIPVMSDMMTRMMAYAQAHPEGMPKSATGQPVLPPEMMPDMSRLVVPMTIVSVLYVLLLATAVVRRLHDRDVSGWWAALPLPFKILGLAIGTAAAKAMTTFPPRQSPLALVSSLNGLCALGTIIVLIVLLVGEGTKGPNRFGEGGSAR
jgi:uncharacterized membrane protein YhaH (DUF805 family)